MDRHKPRKSRQNSYWYCSECGDGPQSVQLVDHCVECSHHRCGACTITTQLHNPRKSQRYSHWHCSECGDGPQSVQLVDHCIECSHHRCDACTITTQKYSQKRLFLTAVEEGGSDQEFGYEREIDEQVEPKFGPLSSPKKQLEDITKYIFKKGSRSGRSDSKSLLDTSIQTRAADKETEAVDSAKDGQRRVSDTDVHVSQQTAADGLADEKKQYPVDAPAGDTHSGKDLAHIYGPEATGKSKKAKVEKNPQILDEKHPKENLVTLVVDALDGYSSAVPEGGYPAVAHSKFQRDGTLLISRPFEQEDPISELATVSHHTSHYESFPNIEDEKIRDLLRRGALLHGDDTLGDFMVGGKWAEGMSPREDVASTLRAQGSTSHTSETSHPVAHFEPFSDAHESRGLLEPRIIKEDNSSPPPSLAKRIPWRGKSIRVKLPPAHLPLVLHPSLASGIPSSTYNIGEFTTFPKQKTEDECKFLLQQNENVDCGDVQSLKSAGGLCESGSDQVTGAGPLEIRPENAESSLRSEIKKSQRIWVRGTDVKHGPNKGASSRPGPKWPIIPLINKRARIRRESKGVYHNSPGYSTRHIPGPIASPNDSAQLNERYQPTTGQIVRDTPTLPLQDRNEAEIRACRLIGAGEEVTRNNSARPSRFENWREQLIDNPIQRGGHYDHFTIESGLEELQWPARTRASSLPPGPRNKDIIERDEAILGFPGGLAKNVDSSPKIPQHEREKEFEGLFTPSYLPLLEGQARTAIRDHSGDCRSSIISSGRDAFAAPNEAQEVNAAVPLANKGDTSLNETKDGSMEAFYIGYTMGRRQRQLEDDELSISSRVSAASSLPSIVDSIFTTLSGSSMSSLPGPQGAGERLVALLLGDIVINQICIDALNTIKHERFERNLRRLLKDFATELRKEADTLHQRHAASFVRFRARNSAHMICSSLAKKTISTPNEKIATELENDECASDDGDSDRSEDEVENPQQLEHFLKSSRAFENFRRKLQAFVYPPEKQAEGMLREEFKPDKAEKDHQKDETSEIKVPSAERPALEASDIIFDLLLDKMMAPFRAVFGSRRPPVLSGKTRLEWQCKCGQKIYDDFIELRPGGTERFKQTLAQSNCKASSNVIRVSSFTSTFSWSLKSFGSFFTVSSRGSKNCLPLHDRHSSVNTLSQSDPPPTTPNVPLAEPQFLPICYSEGRYATRLLQPDVVKLRIDSDQAFFHLLRTSYNTTRRKWTSTFSLKTLSWIKFVHFELYCSELVDVRKVDDIPPPEHVEYRYAPVPPDVIPPVGDNHLMHLFQNPSCASTSPILMQRFPKKILRPLFCPSVNPLTPGWGIQFLTSWDFTKIWLLLFLFFGLGSGLIGILWCVFKHSIQDAFAIAAYVVAFGTVSVGTVQALFVM